MNKYVFYAKKFLKDLMDPLVYDTISDASELSCYYYVKYDFMDMLGHRSQHFSFDNDGIPIIPHYIDSSSKTNESSASFHYFPIAIGQMGLSYLHEYSKTKNTDFLDKFINIADWFCNNQTSDGYWLAHTNVDKFKIYKPWKSAMAQSRAISVLLRAHEITHKEEYLESANAAFATLESMNSDICCDFNGRFYLEYPGEMSPKVLNGFIFSVFGLYDFYYFTGCNKAKILFDESIATLKAIIDSYDLGYWTAYDLNHKEHELPLNICTVHYHFIHVSQMNVLYKLTGDIYFKNIEEKWGSYYKNKINLLKIYAIKAKKVLR